MNLSFSTNGWSFSFDELVQIAKENKLKGIEIHDINHSSFDKEEPFCKQNIAKTLRKLNENKLRICCLDAVSNLADYQNSQNIIAEIERLIELAKDLNCPYIRLHAYNSKEQNLDSLAIDKKIIEIIEKVLPIATNNKVTLLIESMGIYADTTRLKNVLDYFAQDYIAALWDIHHTYHFANESPEDTIKNLGGYIRHLHIKDSKKNGDKIVYCLLGEGELPLNSVFDSLRSINYEKSMSLELQPSWIEDFADGDIVLPQFVSYMGSFEEIPSWQKKIYYNKRKTGRYIWEKDVLIDYTFSQMLDKVVAEFPDQYAFKYTTLDYTRTYAEFRDDVDTFARTLIALGVKPGDHVAIWATNIPEWFITFWATVKIGAVLVTVNTAYKIHEVEYLLRQSDTHTLVMIERYRDSNYAQIINELCPELATLKKGQSLHARRLPFLRNVITCGFSQKGSLTFEESLAYAKKVPLEEVYRRAANVDKHDVCNMQYTSGTTGFPKGVMLTHYNIVNNGKCIGDRMDLSTADRMMIQVPMFHCFGMVLSMTACMTHGSTLLPLPYFSPKPALACINQERITCFNGVPTMFIALLNHEDFAKTDFSYMRTGIMAGSLCPVSVMRDVQEKMNMKEITIVFGQTESSPGCTQSSTDDPIEVRVSTVGSPLPNIECKIVDPETNKELPDNEIGEFVVRGYNLMKGYYKMPKATANAIDEDGWLHTGDLALRRPDGNFQITGRLRDMIIRGGENLYPKEIEDFIYTHPKVQDVQVVGVDDKVYGEEAYAYVILKEGQSMTEEELRQFSLERMARHKVPKYIEFTDSFPTNAAGKILKYKMREAAEAKLKALNKN
ncbi:MAG: AMP-binding protein [Clostridiales bacterium]|nr:AMP-binding protein [Clostridiales bacterium]